MSTVFALGDTLLGFQQFFRQLSGTENLSPKPVSECVLDRQAISSALMDHLDALYGYALMLTQSQSEAEDLVQETCLRALRAAHQLQPQSQLKNWLFTILRNLFLNQIRKGQSRAEIVPIDAEETTEAAWRDERSDDPHTMLEKKSEREQVQAELASLPEVYREVLVLREFEGLSYQEMAQVLSCPAGTVMSRLGRARGRLKIALEQITKQRQEVQE